MFQITYNARINGTAMLLARKVVLLCTNFMKFSLRMRRAYRKQVVNKDEARKITADNTLGPAGNTIRSWEHYKPLSILY